MEIQVCGGRVLDLFHARELMSLVVGTENYDWKELEANTQYKNGYDKDHPTIKNFWSVFHHELALEDKKKFLLYLTGSDRIPILGESHTHSLTRLKHTKKSNLGRTTAYIFTC